MPLQYKAYKFRLYPTKPQAELMQKTFGCARFVYNQMLAYNMDGHKEHGKAWKLDFSPTTIRKEHEFLQEVSYASLDRSLRNLKLAYASWFNSLTKKRKGKPVQAPKFKSKHKSRKSFKLQSTKFRLDGVRLRLEKIGWVKTRGLPELPKQAKFISVTVTQNASGEYFASICAEVEVGLIQYTDKVVGIDLGLKDFVVLSSGQRVQAPKFFRESQARLKKAQQHLSRKVRGSNSYERQKRKVARVHRDIVNKRQWFLHDLTTKIVRDYGVICIEDLNVDGMLKNHKLAKSIADASWSEFVRQLEYKSAWYGRTLVKVDRFYPSSKTCSCCGYVNQDLVLSDREWTCTNCHTVIDRDLNAAYNIASEGHRILSGKRLDYRGGAVDVDGVETFSSFECFDNRLPQKEI